MKAIKCEMCNSNDIVKEENFFVCQSCGTKYTIEAAKKLMIDGIVNVSGSTVKIDQSDELKNLYELARRAKNDNNSENAQKFYDQILLKDPSSWEANFYTVYYQSMNSKIADIQSAAIRLSNCEDTILQLIKDNIIDPQEQKEAVSEMATKLISISEMLYNAAKNHYNGIDASIKSKYKQETLNNCFAAIDICYNFGNHVIEFFGDEYGKDIAVPCWKTGIFQHKNILFYLAQKRANKNIIMNYSSKIQKYDSTYRAPNGCYVATCVYGSYNCPQVWTLRRYRDNALAKSWYGRLFIKIYYATSPTLVNLFGNNIWFKKIFQPKLDRIVKKLNDKGVKNTPYQDRNW